MGRRVGRTTGIAGLLLSAGLLTACGGGGDDPEGSTPGDGSAEAAPTDDTDEATSEEPSEDASPEEPTADSTPTPPGTVLQPDEPAVVSLPYTGGGRGLYAVDLVDVEKRPASDIPPEVPIDGPTDLYYVTQDWTMLDRGNGSVTGMNLLNHTSVSLGDDLQVTSLLFTDPAGCEVAQFIPEDGDAGKTRRSCTPYLVPRREDIEQVWYFEFNTDYDYSIAGGSPVRWQLDG